MSAGGRLDPPRRGPLAGFTSSVLAFSAPGTPARASFPSDDASAAFASAGFASAGFASAGFASAAGFGSARLTSAGFTFAGFASTGFGGATLFASAVKSLDFAGGLTSGRRCVGGPFVSAVLEPRLGGGGATGAGPRALGTGAGRCVVEIGCGALFDGRPIGGFFFGSFGSRGAAIAARDAAMDALVVEGAFVDVGPAPDVLLGAASGRMAGMRVVESMRVGGRSSPASASE